MLRLFISVAFALGASYGHAEDAAEEVAFAKAVLGKLQPKSTRENIEYCGYIGRDADGTIVATEAEPGGPDWCEAHFPEYIEVTASYHTHAGYDPTAWSEVPSGDDMETDEAEGIDGYVSTPGGRLWYIDTDDMVTFQLCGIGCLPRDPDFQPAPDDNIQQSYTYDEFVAKTDG